ncbi:MAG: nuclear transport factor 2 family protein [Erysipelotrichaceae bacterium]|nr:nuclear transport factor 2 family protein [Erysipelotrichaceae bacterium]
MKKLILLSAVLTALMTLTGCGTDVSAPQAQTQNQAETEVTETEEVNSEAMSYDFKQFKNVSITGIELSSLNEEELAVLYAQARYCQAMTDADIETMRELVSEDMVFTHMSGRQQTREEYFADVADGSLRYFTIGIADPSITADGDKAEITYTSVLNANAYGARGTFHMKGTHHYEKRDGTWIAVNR